MSRGFPNQSIIPLKSPHVGISRLANFVGTHQMCAEHQHGKTPANNINLYCPTQPGLAIWGNGGNRGIWMIGPLIAQPRVAT